MANPGQFQDRQSVVMIQNAMIVDGEEDREPIQYQDDRDADSEDHNDRDANTHLIGALDDITLHNEVLRRQSSKGSARAKGGDSRICTQLEP